MILAVDNLIVNSLFDEPTRYWDYKEGQPVLAEQEPGKLLPQATGKLTDARRVRDG